MIQNYPRFYLKAAKADAEVEKRAKYLAVIALSDHEQLRYWPSTVAAGVVIMASMDGNQHGSYHQVIEVKDITLNIYLDLIIFLLKKSNLSCICRFI